MSQIILDSANDLIQGDFDNATLSQRTRLQTSTINATTGVYVVPNGTANAASVQISNAADPTNASKVVLATNGSTDTQIISGANGSGTYLPLSFYTNNDIRFQMGNNGELNVRTAPGTVSSGTSGQFLTSGGPGAGVSWTTVATGSPGIRAATFSSPGTFTVPSSTTAVKVTVIGGGGGGANVGPGGNAGGGGSSGANIQYITGITPGASIPVTVGAGGSAGVAGGTSSIGPFGPGGTVSQTGGGGGFNNGGGGSGSAGGGFGYNGSSGQTVSSSPVGGNGFASGALSGVFNNGLFLSSGGAGASGPAPGGTGTRGGGGGGGWPGNPAFGGGSGGAGLVIVEF